MKPVRNIFALPLVALALVLILQVTGHIWWRTNAVTATWGLDVGVLSRSYGNGGAYLVQLPVYGDSFYIAYPSKRKVAIMDRSGLLVNPFFILSKESRGTDLSVRKTNLANDFSIKDSTIIEFKCGNGVLQLWFR